MAKACSALFVGGSRSYRVDCDFFHWNFEHCRLENIVTWLCIVIQAQGGVSGHSVVYQPWRPRLCSHTFSFYLYVLQLPLQSTDCCTQYVYNWDLVQGILLISTPVVPPTYILLCRELWGSIAKKHAGLHTAKCNWMWCSILVFLEYCIFNTVYFSRKLNSMVVWVFVHVWVSNLL